MPHKQTETEKPPVRQGQMTVEEAGRLGGHKGGQRVRRLIDEGKQAERAHSDEDIDTTEEDKDGEA
jgi:hypothetical protein